MDDSSSTSAVREFEQEPQIPFHRRRSKRPRVVSDLPKVTSQLVAESGLELRTPKRSTLLSPSLPATRAEILKMETLSIWDLGQEVGHRPQPGPKKLPTMEEFALKTKDD